MEKKKTVIIANAYEEISDVLIVPECCVKLLEWLQEKEEYLGGDVTITVVDTKAPSLIIEE